MSSSKSGFVCTLIARRCWSADICIQGIYEYWVLLLSWFLKFCPLGFCLKWLWWISCSVIFWSSFCLCLSYEWRHFRCLFFPVIRQSGFCPFGSGPSSIWIIFRWCARHYKLSDSYHVSLLFVQVRVACRFSVFTQHSICALNALFCWTSNSHFSHLISISTNLYLSDCI